MQLKPAAHCAWPCRQSHVAPAPSVEGAGADCCCCRARVGDDDGAVEAAGGGSGNVSTSGAGGACGPPAAVGVAVLADAVSAGGRIGGASRARVALLLSPNPAGGGRAAVAPTGSGVSGGVALAAASVERSSSCGDGNPPASGAAAAVLALGASWRQHRGHASAMGHIPCVAFWVGFGELSAAQHRCAYPGWYTHANATPHGVRARPPNRIITSPPPPPSHRLQQLAFGRLCTVSGTRQAARLPCGGGSSAAANGCSQHGDAAHEEG